MYVRGEWYGHLDAIGEGAWCDAVTPDDMFVCTLSEGHSGLHRAGTDLSTWVAEWDDNRSTDCVIGPMSKKTDFFRSIGL